MYTLLSSCTQLASGTIPCKISDLSAPSMTLYDHSTAKLGGLLHDGSVEYDGTLSLLIVVLEYGALVSKIGTLVNKKDFIKIIDADQVHKLFFMSSYYPILHRLLMAFSLLLSKFLLMVKTGA